MVETSVTLTSEVWPMQLKSGLRLQSVTCDTQVIVVRGSGDVDLRCGGQPLVPAGGAVDKVAPAAGFDTGTLMGKRYGDEESGLEILCTKPGAGSLSVGDVALPEKGAKALPSSD
jgi:hypothetical protein